MNRALSVIFASAFVAVPALAAGADLQPVSLPMDTPISVNGILSVCTGAGSNERANPEWDAYPLKVSVAGKDGQYLGDEVVRVDQRGKELLSVDCRGPVVLFKLSPGSYRVGAESGGVEQQSTAHVGASGQGRLLMRFPAQGGEVSPPNTPTQQ